MSPFNPEKMTNAVKDDKTIIVSGENHIDLKPQGGECIDSSDWFCAEQPDIFEMAITQSDFQAEMSDTDLRNEENYRDFKQSEINGAAVRLYVPSRVHQNTPDPMDAKQRLSRCDEYYNGRFIGRTSMMKQVECTDTGLGDLPDQTPDHYYPYYPKSDFDRGGPLVRHYPLQTYSMDLERNNYLQPDAQKTLSTGPELLEFNPSMSYIEACIAAPQMKDQTIVERWRKTPLTNQFPPCSKNNEDNFCFSWYDDFKKVTGERLLPVDEDFKLVFAPKHDEFPHCPQILPRGGCDDESWQSKCQATCYCYGNLKGSRETFFSVYSRPAKDGNFETLGTYNFADALEYSRSLETNIQNNMDDGIINRLEGLTRMGDLKILETLVAVTPRVSGGSYAEEYAQHGQCLEDSPASWAYTIERYATRVSGTTALQNNYESVWGTGSDTYKLPLRFKNGYKTFQYYRHTYTSQQTTEGKSAKYWHGASAIIRVLSAVDYQELVFRMHTGGDICDFFSEQLQLTTHDTNSKECKSQNDCSGNQVCLNTVATYDGAPARCYDCPASAPKTAPAEFSYATGRGCYPLGNTPDAHYHHCPRSEYCPNGYKCAVMTSCLNSNLEGNALQDSYVEHARCVLATEEVTAVEDLVDTVNQPYPLIVDHKECKCTSGGSDEQNGCSQINGELCIARNGSMVIDPSTNLHEGSMCSLHQTRDPCLSVGGSDTLRCFPLVPPRCTLHPDRCTTNADFPAQEQKFEAWAPMYTDDIILNLEALNYHNVHEAGDKITCASWADAYTLDLYNYVADGQKVLIDPASNPPLYFDSAGAEKKTQAEFDAVFQKERNYCLPISELSAAKTMQDETTGSPDHKPMPKFCYVRVSAFDIDSSWVKKVNGEEASSHPNAIDSTGTSKNVPQIMKIVLNNNPEFAELNSGIKPEEWFYSPQLVKVSGATSTDPDRYYRLLQCSNSRSTTTSVSTEISVEESIVAEEVTTECDRMYLGDGQGAAYFLDRDNLNPANELENTIMTPDSGTVFLLTLRCPNKNSRITNRGKPRLFMKKEDNNIALKKGTYDHCTANNDCRSNLCILDPQLTYSAVKPEFSTWNINNLETVRDKKPEYLFGRCFEPDEDGNPPSNLDIGQFCITSAQCRDRSSCIAVDDVWALSNTLFPPTASGAMARVCVSEVKYTNRDAFDDVVFYDVTQYEWTFCILKERYLKKEEENLRKIPGLETIKLKRTPEALGDTEAHVCFKYWSYWSMMMEVKDRNVNDGDTGSTTISFLMHYPVDYAMPHSKNVNFAYEFVEDHEYTYDSNARKLPTVDYNVAEIELLLDDFTRPKDEEYWDKSVGDKGGAKFDKYPDSDSLKFFQDACDGCTTTEYPIQNVNLCSSFPDNSDICNLLEHCTYNTNAATDQCEISDNSITSTPYDCTGFNTIAGATQQQIKTICTTAPYCYYDEQQSKCIKTPCTENDPTENDYLDAILEENRKCMLVRRTVGVHVPYACSEPGGTCLKCKDRNGDTWGAKCNEGSSTPPAVHSSCKLVIKDEVIADTNEVIGFGIDFGSTEACPACTSTKYCSQYDNYADEKVYACIDTFSALSRYTCQKMPRYTFFIGTDDETYVRGSFPGTDPEATMCAERTTATACTETDTSLGLGLCEMTSTSTCRLKYITTPLFLSDTEDLNVKQHQMWNQIFFLYRDKDAKDSNNNNKNPSFDDGLYWKSGVEANGGYLYRRFVELHYRHTIEGQNCRDDETCYPEKFSSETASMTGQPPKRCMYCPDFALVAKEENTKSGHGCGVGTGGACMSSDMCTEGDECIFETKSGALGNGEIGVCMRRTADQVPINPQSFSWDTVDYCGQTGHQTINFYGETPAPTARPTLYGEGYSPEPTGEPTSFAELYSAETEETRQTLEILFIAAMLAMLVGACMITILVQLTKKRTKMSLEESIVEKAEEEIKEDIKQKAREKYKEYEKNKAQRRGKNNDKKVKHRINSLLT